MQSRRGKVSHLSAAGIPEVANRTQQLGSGGGGLEEQRRRPFRGICFGCDSMGHMQWGSPENVGKISTRDGVGHQRRPESGGMSGDGNLNPSGVFRGTCFKCAGCHRQRDCPLNEVDDKVRQQEAIEVQIRGSGATVGSKPANDPAFNTRSQTSQHHGKTFDDTGQNAILATSQEKTKIGASKWRVTMDRLSEQLCSIQSWMRQKGSTTKESRETIGSP